MEMRLQEQMGISSRIESTPCDSDAICCLADGFKALADATRLQVIHLLMTHGEMCVCEFMPLLGLTQSNVSFHLKTLKYAGFVTHRKEGKWMLYSLNRVALEKFHSSFSTVLDLNKWPENTVPASCEKTI